MKSEIRQDGTAFDLIDETGSHTTTDTMQRAKLYVAAPDLLEALKGMIEAGHLGVKLNVRKSEHFSWMNADACARKAVLQAEGG
jgi:hypothetical protein